MAFDNPLSGKNINQTDELDCLRQIQLYLAGLADSTGTGGGGATAAKQQTQITAEQAILAKIIAAPATEAKQDTGNTSLASILAKITSDPATQTTLAAVLAKLSSDPSTATLQGTGNTALAAVQALLGATNGAAVITDANGTAQQYLRGLIVLALLQATAAKQDTLLSALTKVGATTVAGISEVDTYTTGATSNHTVTAGAIAIAINFSSTFTGTVQGAAYDASVQGVALSRVAQPGNLLPALAVTRTTGSYDYYVVTPT